MQTSIDIDLSPTARVAQLEMQLLEAQERARVAEEQLQRVHVAVRAFKQKQVEAREAHIKAAQHQQALQQQQQQQQQAQAAADRSSLYSSWATADPSLDNRLDEYLQSDFEPDRSRDWMLRE